MNDNPGNRQSLPSNLPIELRFHIYDLLFPHRTQVFGVEHSRACRSHGPPLRTFDDPASNEWLVYRMKTRSRTIRLFGANHLFTVFKDNIPENQILFVSKQIHREAVEILYRRTTFDFSHALQAVVPFLESIGSYGRAAVQHFKLSPDTECCTRWKSRGLWMETCEYIAQNSDLRTLSVAYTYKAGGGWSAEQWARKVAMEQSSTLPLDAGLRRVLQSTTEQNFTHVLSVNPQTAMPNCQDFLEMLPIESIEEQRTMLGLDGEEPVDPFVKGLVKIRELDFLGLTMRGAVAEGVRGEIEDFLVNRMMKQERTGSRLPSGALADRQIALQEAGRTRCRSRAFEPLVSDTEVP